MSTVQLVIRSLIHYRRTHAAVVLGSAIATGVLVGALLVGHSQRKTMRQLAESRLMNVRYATMTGNRFFAASLGQRVAKNVKQPVVAVFQTQAAVIAREGKARANRVQVLGVDKNFQFGEKLGEYATLKPDTALINGALAVRLGIKAGDEVVLRLPKPSLLPGDAPMSKDAGKGVATRVKITGIAQQQHLGDFSLRNDSRIPLNLFVNREWLAGMLDMPGKANGMLAGDGVDPKQLVPKLQLKDVGLELREYPGSDEMELRSDRIFIEPALAKALLPLGRGLMTYFVNEFKLGQKTTPYSFVVGGSSRVPEAMNDDQIVINQWLADDLDAKVGDTIELSYFLVAAGRGLSVASAKLRVYKILSMAEVKGDQELMPLFPGMASAESCTDWDPGLPVNLKRVRKKDEDYWDKYKGMPKAYVTLPAAHKLWSNRFGNYTALRFKKNAGLADKLTGRLKPEMFGLQWMDVKGRQLTAGRQGVDFGMLFISLSFFIIVAAILLAGVLFALTVDQRRADSGLLLALGFTQKQVRNVVLLEGLALADIGAALGVPLGIAFNYLILRQLHSAWLGAVGGVAIEPSIDLMTLFIGYLAGLLAALAGIWLIARKQVRASIRELQARNVRSRSGSLLLFIGLAFLIGGVAIAAMGDAGAGREATGIFMGAGFCWLVGSVLFTGWLLKWLGRDGAGRAPGLVRLCIRNISTRLGRGLAVVGLLAAGVYLVVGVGANQHDPMKGGTDKRSGVGGFWLYAQSTVPINRDLNSKEGRRPFLLDEPEFDGVKFVQMRLKSGGDASCLNLNRVFTPQILGVDSTQLHGRFAFAAAANDRSRTWDLLEHQFDDGAIPAIADNNVIQWSMGKGLGDTVTLTDENGNHFPVRFIAGLKNSIFQGSILISSRYFVQRYPSISGSRVLLAEVPPGKREGIQAKLTEAFQDAGVEWTLARARLAEFNRVESTYLRIFLALGGLGVILGSLGLGIVVMRNVLERRSELAILRACGFARGRIRMLIALEHLILLAAGIISGVLAAGIGTLPAIKASTGDVPWRDLATWLVSLSAIGGVWALAATYIATRGDILPALRNE